MAAKKASKTVKKGSYGAADITVLEGLEPVRKRPGMYIGTTGLEGLHHLIWEVFDNARDEAMGGYANRVEVVLLPDNRVRVSDNGRGIPIDIHKQTKVSALQTIMTTLHAGGKFDQKAYAISGGLHGVGVSVVNALSTYAKVEVHRDGGVHMQEYSIGKPKAKVKKVGASQATGSIVTFEPDPSIFPEIVWDFEKVVSHLRQQAYLVKGMRIDILDARELSGTFDPDLTFFFRDQGLDVPSMSFYFEGGLLSLVKFTNEHQKAIHKNIFYIEKQADEKVWVEVSLQYVDDISARLLAFANNTYNSEGGMHMTGFKAALTRTLNSFARKNKVVKEGEDAFTGDDVLEGLTAVISVKLPEIQFEGQTKAKLGSVEARGAVESVFADAFGAFLEEHPDDARAIIGKVVLAQKARKAAKAAKDSVLRKGALDGLALPGKLADCQSKSAEESELFIVEGDSAGGSAKAGRDRRTQAILPMWGKVLNVERARLDKIVTARGVKELIIAMGTAIGDTFDVSRLRYHKIIIATDADVDGAHIRTLFLTLFYRYFKEIIDGGYLYIAQPPLYKIQRGKEVLYAYTDADKTKILGKDASVLDDVPQDDDESAGTGSEEENGGDGDLDEAGEKEDGGKGKGKSARISIQRYKGLGEMNADELWETTMDPERRVLKQVTIEDAREADKIFDILMGSDVAPRKAFIQSNAKLATLDI